MPLDLNGQPLSVSSSLPSSSAWEGHGGKNPQPRVDVALASADEGAEVQEAEAASCMIKNTGHKN